MFPKLLDHLTPRAYPRTRLLTAAVVWSTVGFFLAGKGVWLLGDATRMQLVIAILAGLGLGLVKSRFIFDSVAQKIIAHIGRKPSRACLGGLFSARNWALIVVMALFGRTLGALPLDSALKTGLYVMVGSGLVYSSRLLWNAWKNSPDHLP
jgi:hypothetical protein